MRTRPLAVLAVLSFLTGLALVVSAPPAAAAPVHGLGYGISPAQPYLHNPDHSDWVGSYLVGGKQAWCVDYAFKAPDSNEQYKPGEALRTKWGTELSPEVSADISYLLLRYATTSSNDESAALSYLLHAWTAPPQGAHTTSAALGFRDIAYDATYHLAKLPAGAQAAASRLQADAAANHGPWTSKITAPAAPQTIGTPDTWTVTVTNAAGKPMAGVPVAFTLTDATIDGKTSATVPTSNGPLAVKVTPTGPKPTVAISLDSPADRPIVQQSVQVDTQRIVSTGGEKKLTGSAATTAVTAPGSVAIAKTDATSGAGITGVSLRLTAADKTAAAVGQDGRALAGTDGAPVVVVTGADGKATISNLRTPQDVCVIEVAAPKGYEQGFDPGSPPSACGTVEPGDTLTLSLTNKPNAPPVVPRAIPAGDASPVVASAAMSTGSSTPIMFGLAAIVLMTIGAGTLLARRRAVVRVRLRVGKAMREDWGPFRE